MSTSIFMGKLLGFVSIKSRIFNRSFKLYLNISKNISPAAKIIFEAKAAWQMLKFYCKYSLLIRNITANLTFKFLNVRFTLFLRWLFSCEKNILSQQAQVASHNVGRLVVSTLSFCWK